MKRKTLFSKMIAAVSILLLMLCFGGCANEPAADPTSTNADGTVIYKVSGVWKFNEELVPSDEIEISDINKLDQHHLNVDFTSGGKAYNMLFWSWFQYRKDDPEIALAYQSSPNSPRDLAYDMDEWKSEDYKTIDFGEHPQEVDKWFYHWLLKNAQKQK